MGTEIEYVKYNFKREHATLDLNDKNSDSVMCKYWYGNKVVDELWKKLSSEVINAGKFYRRIRCSD